MKKILLFFFAFIVFFRCSENSTKNNSQTTEQEKIPVNSKNNFFSFIVTPSQAFTINNKKDTSITGEKGTKIFIPKNCFNSEDGQPVEIKLKECYSYKDFLSENLTTTSNGKQIESNGMIHLSANSNGKEIELKKSKKISIGFPKNKQKKEFKLFYGNKDSSNNINWQPDFTYSKKNKGAEIAKKEKNQKEFKIATYSFPETTSMDLLFENESIGDVQDYFSDNFKFSLTEAIPFPPNESVDLRFILNKQGKLIYQSADFYYNEPLKKKLTAFFKTLPNFKPNKTEIGESQETPVYFTITPNTALSDYLYSDSTNVKLTRKIIQKKQEEEFVAEKQRQEKENTEFERLNKINKEKDDKWNELQKIMGEMYISFSSSKLGWINCDRFSNDPNPKIEFVIENAGIDFQARLIFKDIKSMMNARANEEQKLSFKNIPENKDVRIIAIKIENDQPLIAISEINTEKKSCKLDFKKYTKAEAEKLFAGL